MSSYRIVDVALRLKDGTYLDGPLRSFSSQLEKNDSGAFTLRRPLGYARCRAGAMNQATDDPSVVWSDEVRAQSVRFYYPFSSSC